MVLLISCEMFEKEPEYAYYNPHIKSIKNFDDYSSIGIGTISQGNSGKSVELYAKALKSVLIGLNEITDEVEVINFMTSANGSLNGTNLCVNILHDTDPFILVQFKKNVDVPTTWSFTSTIGCLEYSQVYLVSKKTGNVYGLGKSFPFCSEGSYSWSRDSLFAMMYDDEDLGGTERGDTIFKITEVDDELVIEPWVNKSYIGWYFASDNEGNLYTSSRKLTTEKNLVVCFDGDKKQYDGTIGKESCWPYEDCVIDRGLERIYWNSRTKGLARVTFADETLSEFEEELILPPLSSSKMTLLNRCLYSMGKDFINCYDIETESSTHIPVGFLVEDMGVVGMSIKVTGTALDYITKKTAFIDLETNTAVEVAPKRRMMSVVHLSPL